MCEISKRDHVGDRFASKDVLAAFFASAEGIRFVDCLAPSDPAIDARLLAPLDARDEATRIWPAFVRLHRSLLSQEDFAGIASHLNDRSLEVREHPRWLLYSRGTSLSPRVRSVIRERDPLLAAALPPPPLPAGGAARPRH